MQFLLYIFGNFFCLTAAGLLIWHQVLKKKLGMDKSSPSNDDTKMLVSKDLQVLLALGSFARVYWSVSPPPVWSSEPMLIQWLSWADVYATPLIWVAVVLLVTFQQEVEVLVKKTQEKINGDASATNQHSSNQFGMSSYGQNEMNSFGGHDSMHQRSGFGQESSNVGQVSYEKDDYKVPIYLSWPVLTLAGVLCALVGPTLMGSYDDFSSWDYAVHMVVFNMTIEALAMIPQMHMIAYSKARASSSTSHFVGLLSLGRVLRVIFWITLLGPKIIQGHYAGVMWEFVLPDIIHTIIMGDYLWLWMKKVKRDQIDGMISHVAMNV